jgi:hypothetical protein
MMLSKDSPPPSVNLKELLDHKLSVVTTTDENLKRNATSCCLIIYWTSIRLIQYKKESFEH